MARDVNDIVVLGFGSWSDVYGLPTLGFATSPGSSEGAIYQSATYVAGAIGTGEYRAGGILSQQTAGTPGFAEIGGLDG